MPTVDFLPFANTPGSDVTSQPDWVIALAPAGSLVDGFPSGIVEKEKFNKAIRQATVMSAALANFVSDTLGEDVLDDGNLANLISQITQAVQESANEGAWSTGDLKLTMKSVADVGWVMVDNGSLGSAISGATHAGAEFQALFELLWTNVTDTYAPVSTGRGGSAASDWAANKRITMTAMLGRALAIAGAGVGLTARALGEALGSEDAVVVTHAHGVTQTPHVHSTGAFGAGVATGGDAGYMNTGFPGNTGGANANVTIDNAGVSGAGKNMQPTGFVRAMLKL